MMWESKAKKDSSFLKGFLKKDSHKDTENPSPNPQKKSSKQQEPHTKDFVHKLLDHSHEEASDEEEVSISVLGI